YSSGVRPCFWTRSAVMAGSVINQDSLRWRCVAYRSSRRFRNCLALQSVNQAFKDEAAIRAAEQRFAGAFRMRHQAGDVAAFVANTGDIQQRSVGIGALRQLVLCVAILP